MFFPGDRLQGDLTSIGSVTLTNTSGSECDLTIEDVVFNMQEIVEALGRYSPNLRPKTTGICGFSLGPTISVNSVDLFTSGFPATPLIRCCRLVT
jgi:hypothetical protein